MKMKILQKTSRYLQRSITLDNAKPTVNIIDTETALQKKYQKLKIKPNIKMLANTLRKIIKTENRRITKVT